MLIYGTYIYYYFSLNLGNPVLRLCMTCACEDEPRRMRISCAMHAQVAEVRIILMYNKHTRIRLPMRNVI